MKEKVILNRKEQKRLMVLNEVEAGRLKGREAAAVLGLSLRQVRRLLAAYRERGAAGLAHGNRGRISSRRLPEATRERIVELARTPYADYNDQHLTEVLWERHDIQVSRSTVRTLRREAGLPSPRRHRPSRHRQRRPRYPQEGMLLQVDGSDHDWLEGRGPRLTLIAAIDDATNEVPAAVFREQEDAAGYFLLMERTSQTHGLPLAVYADRHTIFQSPKKQTLAQELAGERPQSQFGRLLDQLEIELIPAYSPQAKGRIERLFGTLQDRLVKALREAGADDQEKANRVLATFLPGFNARFMRPAEQAGSAYRPWPTAQKPEELFCFKYSRTVANDNTVSMAGHKLQIPPGKRRYSYARARVELRHSLDGRLFIYYQGECLATFEPREPGPPRVGKFTPASSSEPAPSPPPTQPEQPSRPAKKGKKPWKPSADHPWRRTPIYTKPTD
ncbi:MAG TPA: ISNCY family transposase [Anaerolineales bacterium]|nr:ISNCY family transposase [Anaerolineales bacterium]